MLPIHLETMARFRSMALRPVHRIKHVVDSQQATTVGTAVNVTLIFAVDAPVLANTTEVEVGSKVNGIFLVVEAYATTGAALSNFYMMIFKNPGNNLTLPAPNVVGASDNKRYSIHQEMVMLQREPTADSAGGNPRTVFKGVIALPRGYRRFGPGDTLVCSVLTPGVTSDFCVQCHYKEFR